MAGRRKKQIAIGTIMALIIILVVVFFYGIKADNRQDNPEITSIRTDSFDEKVHNVEPDKAYLRSIDTEGFGLTKRIYANGKFMHTVSASLPLVEDPEFYQGWLVKPGNDVDKEEFIATGKLIYTESEFFLFYESDQDLKDFSKIIVSKQIQNDAVPNSYVLVGSFAN